MNKKSKVVQINRKRSLQGELYFNVDKPDGTMKKLTDVYKLHGLGWKHSVELEDGIGKMYTWYSTFLSQVEQGT